MATDISLVGNVVEITEGSGQPQVYSGGGFKYSFNAAGTILNLICILSRDTYSIPLADLRVAGAGSPPADVAAAYTALSTVFPSAGASAIPTLAQVLEAGNNANNLSITNLSAISANTYQSDGNDGVDFSGDVQSINVVGGIVTDAVAP